ncbi:DMT family transporter [Fusibacter tunisiensis]|uniref:Drug/metabolite transporter (DMT)-like permease n=1 Tax=Fusibacter tunisiensis TaxID=1008308 RepID=A0ABS2MSJ3_9FIRM|nr:DMT family transporter [Fusibacter tunisiensis]MBM7562330.1 drug/metabolite transporter (DMT)-like permease [Fusibacter tunisiensis]
MQNKTKGLISVTIPVLFWGISFVSTEYLLAFLGPMTIGGIRFIIATAIMYGMMRLHKQPLKIDPKDRILFILAGAIGIAIYFYFENLGIYYISASPASLIIASIPMVTLIFEAILYKRRIGALDFFAIVISILGVVLVVDMKLKDFFSADEAIGYLMMLGAVVSWVIYSMASRPLFKKYSYLTIIYYQFFYSLPLFIIAIPFENNLWHDLTLSGYGHLIFLSIFASVLGFYYYAKAMDLLGITESALFINFLPIITIIFSYFYLGDLISMKQMAGGALIMLSLTLTTAREKKRVVPNNS